MHAVHHFQAGQVAMADLGATLVGGPPEQFAKFIAVERAKYADLIKKQGIKAN